MDGYKLYAAIKKVADEMGATIHYKPESRLMRVIGGILFFNKAFMTRFTTTIGKKVYFSQRFQSEWEHENKACVLAHELVHVEDYIERPIQFTLGYLFPQILALFALLAFGGFCNLNYLWFLLCLLFLLPIPSPGRATAEIRGYSVSMAIRKWLGQYPDYEYRRFFRTFTGPNYYYMWPFKKNLEKRFRCMAAFAEANQLDKEIPVARRIYAAVRSVEEISTVAQ